MRRLTGSALFGMSTAVLIAAAVAVFLAESRTNSEREERRREFHTLTGGLGFGPAVDLSRCPNCFDPRVGFVCEQERGPIPAGQRFCRHHAASIFYYPPLTPEEADGKVR